MRLYDIQAELQHILDHIEQNEGEISEELETLLDSLTLEREKKLAGFAYVIKNFAAEQEALKFERKRLQAKEAVLEARLDRIKTYLGKCLGEGNKFSNGIINLSWLPSSSVEVDEEKLPSIYWATKVVKSPDKAMIKQDLAVPGTIIPGASIKKSMNLQIK